MRKNSIYGNWSVVSPDGDPMFRCGDHKARWYLSRGLATKTDNPNTIKLTFNPNGVGHRDDLFYLQDRLNRCVVCGSTELSRLTRHHVVPYCYRRFFPLQLKQHNYHDVVPLCCECHDQYEDYADTLKKELAEKYDAPVNGKGNNVDLDILRVRKFSHALNTHWDEIPSSRREEMLAIVREHLGKSDVNKDDLKKLADLQYYYDTFYSWHGQIVVDKLGIDRLQDFCNEWRRHFIEKMSPKFMPENWEVERQIGT